MLLRQRFLIQFSIFVSEKKKLLSIVRQVFLFCSRLFEINFLFCLRFTSRHLLRQFPWSSFRRSQIHLYLLKCFLTLAVEPLSCAKSIKIDFQYFCVCDSTHGLSKLTQLSLNLYKVAQKSKVESMKILRRTVHHNEFVLYPIPFFKFFHFNPNYITNARMSFVQKTYKSISIQVRIEDNEQKPWTEGVN
jgi:hypothetical protein